MHQKQRQQRQPKLERPLKTRAALLASNRRQLDQMPDPELAHARRGAEWTFDARAYHACLAQIKATGGRAAGGHMAAALKGCTKFAAQAAHMFHTGHLVMPVPCCTGEAEAPSFDHGVGDPAPGDIRVGRQHRVVLTEGNYLLLVGPHCLPACGSGRDGLCSGREGRLTSTQQGRPDVNKLLRRCNLQGALLSSAEVLHHSPFPTSSRQAAEPWWKLHELFDEVSTLCLACCSGLVRLIDSCAAQVSAPHTQPPPVGVEAWLARGWRSGALVLPAHPHTKPASLPRAQAWFIDCEVDTAMQRVFERQTGNGLAPEVSRWRIAANDRPNAEQIATTASTATLLVPTLPLA